MIQDLLDGYSYVDLWLIRSLYDAVHHFQLVGIEVEELPRCDLQKLAFSVQARRPGRKPALETPTGSTLG